MSGRVHIYMNPISNKSRPRSGRLNRRVANISPAKEQKKTLCSMRSISPFLAALIGTKGKEKQVSCTSFSLVDSELNSLLGVRRLTKKTANLETTSDSLDNASVITKCFSTRNHSVDTGSCKNFVFSNEVLQTLVLPEKKKAPPRRKQKPLNVILNVKSVPPFTPKGKPPISFTESLNSTIFDKKMIRRMLTK